MQQHYDKIARESSIVFLSNISLLALSYFTGILVIRALGAEGYGLYNIGLSVILLVTLLGGLGLNDTLIRHISYYYAKNDIAAVKSVFNIISRNTLYIYIILSLFLLIFSRFIAVTVFQKPQLTYVLMILALSFPALRWTDITSGFFSAKKQFAVPSLIYGVITPVIKLFFAAVLLIFSLSVLEWSIVYTLTAYLVAIVCFFIYKKNSPNLRRITKKEDQFFFHIKIFCSDWGSNGSDYPAESDANHLSGLIQNRRRSGCF